MAAKKIPLERILSALDRKDRDFYDNLDEDEKKAFSGFLMLRYSSAIGPDFQGRNKPSADLIAYYIRSTNEVANKHMFSLSKHPKLQWLMLTAASPGMGTFHHSWLKQKPKVKSANAPLKKQLATFFPAMKEDELELLSAISTKKEIKEYIKAHGEGSKA